MTSTTLKAHCIKCDNSIGQFKCEGCSQRFCVKHVVEHRQILNQKLEEIILEHKALQQTANENKNPSQFLLASIEQWEQKSIEKIRQMANEARQKVVQLVNTHKSEFRKSYFLFFMNRLIVEQAESEELQNLTKEIAIACENDGFFETDLQHWTSILEKAKHQLKAVALSAEMKEDKTVPLVYQLQIVSSSSKLISLETVVKTKSNYYEIEPDSIVSDEKFDRCYGNGKIQQHGHLVTNGTDSFFGTEIRGKAEYSSGVHEIRFQIENNPSKIWIFIGIITKGARMGGNLFTSSSVYGWGDYNDYFLAGHRQKTNSDVFFIHTRENDIVVLMLDCIERTIRYTIERTQQSEQLSIDMNKCPFPWQLFISLGGRGDQIRLLNNITTL
jgi:hypothetical protein